MLKIFKLIIKDQLHWTQMERERQTNRHTVSSYGVIKPYWHHANKTQPWLDYLTCLLPIWWLTPIFNPWEYFQSPSLTFHRTSNANLQPMRVLPKHIFNKKLVLSKVKLIFLLQRITQDPTFLYQLTTKKVFKLVFA